ncbi:unnamed protein product [Lymnaea stagnalis]|uniref:Serpin domain-containing protein n=1 Tax=Lymnaea stagnalis TaxID=6523 RepID=A0AAV2HP99_LYMST
MVSSLIIVLAIVGCAHRGMGDEGLRELSRAMTKFSQSLHKDLALEQVNSVYSPASIHLALSMAYLGARGSTAEDMKSALQLTNVIDPHKSLQTWVKDVISQKDVRIDIANSLWYNDRFEINLEYKQAFTADQTGHRYTMVSSLIIVLAIVGCAHRGMGDEGLRELSRAMTKFSQSLHKDLALEQVNSVYSPASIHLALSMAYLGARGSTAEDMKSALQLTDVTDPHQSHQTWVRDVISQGDVRVDIANSLWYNDRLEIYPEYKNKVRETYLADVEKLDFSSNKPEQSINEWVANITDNNIREIIRPGQLSEGKTLLALINAIYFNGTWDQPFSEKRTRSGEAFTKPDGTKVKVDLMSREGRFKVKELKSLNADVLKLYFKGKRFSLNFISPKSTSGLRDIEEKLISGSEKLNDILNDMEEEYLDISVPKFKITATMNLNKALKKLGLDKAFSDYADFSGISSVSSKITDVSHETVIEVQESGTVAAAVSSVEVVSNGLPQRFIIDHAFLFFLMDEGQRVILFHGKVTDPTVKKIEIQ